MKRPLLACAVISLALPWTGWAQRPRYGDSLRVQLAGPLGSLDPGERLASAAQETRRDGWSELVFETLAAMGDDGRLQAALALHWTRENDSRVWRFSLRPNVVFHDGKPFNGSAAAVALAPVLKARYPRMTVVGSGAALVLRNPTPLPRLPWVLADTRLAVVKRVEGQPPVGTGAFEWKQWDREAAQHRLTAHEKHWAGRPFLDQLILMERPAAVRMGSAEAWELPVSTTRRVLPEQLRWWTGRASELLALRGSHEHLAALAAAVDRSSLAVVLAQRRGEAAYGLLPQWMSGTAFLLEQPRRLDARRGGTMELAAPAGDEFARAVAERVAVSGRDIGLTVTLRASAPVELVRVRLRPLDVWETLAAVAADLGLGEAALPGSGDGDDPAEWAAEERRLLATGRVAPLLFLPEVWGLHPRVRGWTGLRSLAGVWLEAP